MPKLQYASAPCPAGRTSWHESRCQLILMRLLFRHENRVRLFQENRPLADIHNVSEGWSIDSDSARQKCQARIMIIEKTALITLTHHELLVHAL